MPRNTTPWLRYSRDACSSIVASPLHGTHQEAQKLSTTGFPRSDARSRVPDVSTRLSENAGAGPPSLPASRRERGGRGRVARLGRDRGRGPADLRRLRLVREAPDQQAQQTGDRRESDDLTGELHRPHQAATMNTGVPTSTCSNN